MNVRRSKSKKKEVSPDPAASNRPTILRRIEPLAAMALGLMLVWSMLAPNDSVSVFQGAALVQNLGWLVTALLCAVVVIVRGGFAFSSRSWILLLAAAGWLTWITWLSGGENNPRPAWNGYWQVIAIATCFACSRLLLTGPQSRAAAITVLFCSCLALSFQGLYQVAVTLPAQRAQYEADPDTVLRELGIDAPVGSPQRVRFESRLQSPEPYASYALANSLAVALSAAIVLLWGVGSTHLIEWWRERRFATLVALAIAFSALFVCWVLTRSRAAVVAVPFGVLVHLLSTRKSSRSLLSTKVLSGLLIASSVATLAALIWVARNDALVLSEAPKSMVYRLEYWLSTLQMIMDHGLTGIGLGNFQSYYPLYKLPVASEEVADPHNWVLDIAVTLSIPIALAMVSWIAVLLVRGIQPSSTETNAGPNEQDQTRSKQILYGSMGGGIICILLMHLLVGSELGSTMVCWSMAVICVALGGGALRSGWGSQPAVACAAVITMLVCLLASGSWQASGIAVPIMVLLACMSNARRKEDPGEARPGTPTVLALPAIGLACFLWQAWSPVNRSWQHEQFALIAPNQQRQIDETELAMKADPWDTQPVGWLAMARLQAAASQPSMHVAEAAQPHFELLDEWLDRDRNRFSNWQVAGDLMLDLCEASAPGQIGLSEGGSRAPHVLLERSLNYYQRATNRYPTSVQLHIQLASTAAYAGRWDLFQTELATARALSDATPHLDKKLEAQVIHLPMTSLPDRLRIRAGPSVMVEPWLQWLRTQEPAQAFLQP